MSIQLTEQELNQLQQCYGFQPITLDESKTLPSENEGLGTHIMSTGRIAHFVYHYGPDNITVFKVDEAPVPTSMQKLSTFLNANPDVKELLGL